MKGNSLPLPLAPGLPELQVVVVYRHITQIQAPLFGDIARIPGVVVALAVHQDTVPAAPGGHQQAAGHSFVVASKVLIGDEEGHIPQQIGGKILKLLAGQLEES